MVATQCHDAIAVTFLQVHDELKDAKRIGASIAVIAK